MIAAGVLLLGALAMSPQLREQIERVSASAAVWGSSTQAEMTLPERTICALQLGVYDSGERAASQAQRLASEGVLCGIWQREKMRIVADAALTRDALDQNAAKGHEAYVITDVLEPVSLRLTADVDGIETAKELLEAPDRVFFRLLGQEPLETILDDSRALISRAQSIHTENLLYAQLTKSLDNWCTLMAQTIEKSDVHSARSYARVTMCTLCRELRRTLKSQTTLSQQQSDASTASAQRTPSTAADVMPPA